MKHINNFPIFLESLIQTDGQVFWGSVAAGILVICPTTKRILLNHRSEDVQEPLTWNIYSGKLDDDELEENIDQVAIRELREETGYKGKIDLIPSYIFRKGKFTFYNFIGLVPKEFIPIDNWESIGHQWCTLDEFLEIKPKHFGLRTLIEKDLDTIKKYVI
jgi:8-oxo-dGTP pyrophosphatase MutT (NUDIX family)